MSNLLAQGSSSSTAAKPSSTKIPRSTSAALVSVNFRAAAQRHFADSPAQFAASYLFLAWEYSHQAT